MIRNLTLPGRSIVLGIAAPILLQTATLGITAHASTMSLDPGGVDSAEVVPAGGLTERGGEVRRTRACILTPAGIEWTSRQSASDNDWTSVAWGGPNNGQLFVAVANSGTGTRVMTSPDGITWTSRSSAADNNWRSVTWGGPVGAELFVAVAGSGTGDRVMTSPDGITWTSQSSAADNQWLSVTWGGPVNAKLFVAVAASGSGNRVMTSPDGITWTSRSSAADNQWLSVAWSDAAGVFVAVAQSGAGDRVMTSPDGITWTSRSSAADNDWRSVAWGNAAGVFVAVAQSGAGDRVMTSPDGITWTSRSSAADNNWSSVAWGGPAGNEWFVAVSRSGVGTRVMTSPDGITWTSRNSASDNDWFSVTWGGPFGSESFVAVAETGIGNRVMMSAAQSCPPPPRIPPGPPVDVRAEPTLLGARVSWDPPADEGTDALTLYAVRSWPGGRVCQVLATVTSCEATGLDPEVDYYFTVVPMSLAGWGTPSAPSNTIRPITPRAPGAPISVVAVGGDQQATVSWASPADPGTTPISEYRVTSSPAGLTCVSTGLICTVTGLVNGVMYTFTAEARNDQGWSAASAASNAVTPEPPMLSIAAQRTGRVISLEGQSVSVPSGSLIQVWIRVGSGGEFSPSTAVVPIASDGTFTWQRRLNPRKSIALYVTSDSVRSNTEVLPGR